MWKKILACVGLCASIAVVSSALATDVRRAATPTRRVMPVPAAPPASLTPSPNAPAQSGPRGLPSPASSPQVPGTSGQRAHLNGLVFSGYGEAHTTGVEVFLPAADKAQVTFNGQNVPPQSSGSYWLNYAQSLKPGSIATLSVQPPAKTAGGLSLGGEPTASIVARAVVGDSIQIGPPTWTQPAALSLTWTGGKPPYKLTIVGCVAGSDACSTVLHSTHTPAAVATVPGAVLAGNWAGYMVEVGYTDRLTFVAGQSALRPDSKVELYSYTMRRVTAAVATPAP